MTKGPKRRYQCVACSDRLNQAKNREYAKHYHVRDRHKILLNRSGYKVTNDRKIQHNGCDDAWRILLKVHGIEDVLKRIEEGTRGEREKRERCYLRVVERGGESGPKKAEQGEKHQECADTGMGLGRQVREVALFPAEDVPFLCFVECECKRQ